MFEGVKVPLGKRLADSFMKIINGDRRRDYGPPLENFKTICDYWNIHLDDGNGKNRKIDPIKDFPWLMVLMKAARDINTPKRDNIVDSAGYLALMDDLKGPEDVPFIHQTIPLDDLVFRSAATSAYMAGSNEGTLPPTLEKLRTHPPPPRQQDPYQGLINPYWSEAIGATKRASNEDGALYDTREPRDNP